MRVAPLAFKNNLRIILGSKQEKFKNMEAGKKFRHSYKKERNHVSVVSVPKRK